MGRNASPTKLWPILSVWETMRPPMQVKEDVPRKTNCFQALPKSSLVLIFALDFHRLGPSGSQWEGIGNRSFW